MMDPERLHALAGELFDELVDQPESARRKTLSRVEQESPDVADYARRLLAAESDSKLQRALKELADQAASETDPAGVLGKYVDEHQIEALIGRGGMGAVYRGRRRDPEALVAIKFVTVFAATDDVYRRFDRETTWLAELDHPGIVRYRGSSMDSLGRPYLVMDFVDGRPLSHELQEVSTSVAGTVDLLIEVTEAIHHMHQRGILHRDLKPANVLLTQRDGAPVPVVVDLGVARNLEVPADETIAPGPIGTPDFMAPEQLEYPCAPDVRTDVFGLGAVVFALLTGQSPRHASTGEPAPERRATTTRVPGLRASMVAGAFSSASKRNAEIDADLEAIVRKALARRVEDRYDSAEALGSDLERWRGGFPVDARRLKPMERLGKLLRRRPLESALVGALMATIVAAGVLLFQSFREERDAREDLAKEVRIADDSVRFLGKNVLYQASPQNLGTQAPILEVIRTATEELLEQREELEPEVIVGVGVVFATMFNELDLFDEAQHLVDELLPVSQTLDPLAPKRLDFEHKQGVLTIRKGDPEAGEALLLELVAKLDPWEPDTDLERRAHRGVLAQSKFDLGMVAMGRGESEPAREYLESGLGYAESMVDGEQFVIRLRFALAHLAMTEGRLEDARETYVELRAALVRFQGEDGPDPAAVDLNLSRIARTLGEHERAIELARSAQVILEGAFEGFHELVRSARGTLILALDAAGETREASQMRIPYVDRSYELDRVEPEITQQLLDDLAGLALIPGDESLITDALDLFERRLGAESVEAGRVLVLRAEVLAQLGQVEAAREAAQGALERLGSSEAGTSERARASKLLAP